MENIISEDEREERWGTTAVIRRIRDVIEMQGKDTWVYQWVGEELTMEDIKKGKEWCTYAEAASRYATDLMNTQGFGRIQGTIEDKHGTRKDNMLKSKARFMDQIDGQKTIEGQNQGVNATRAQIISTSQKKAKKSSKSL